RGLTLDWLTRFDHAAVAMDASLVARLTRAAQRSRIPGPGSRIPVMASGAGHDAMILAAHMPAAMLFIRTPGGLSHHPDESVTESDVAVALTVGANFLEEVGRDV